MQIHKMSLVLGSNGAGGRNAYNAPPNGEQTHLINTGLQKDSSIIGVWYQPHDNLADVTRFQSIDVKEAPDNDIYLIVKGSYAQGLLRIEVFIAYE